MSSLDQDIPNLLTTFSGWNRSFSVKEVMRWAEDPLDSDSLGQAFLNDRRFIPLGLDDDGMEHFIPEHTALRWWSRFTVRLAQIGKSRLNEGELAASISSLHSFTCWGTPTDFHARTKALSSLPRWSTPPPALLELAQRHGLVAPAWSPGLYVFPVTHLLLGETMSLLWGRPQAQLDLWPEGNDADPGCTSIVDAVESLLDAAGVRAGRVIRGREGIPPYKRSTLEELGAMFGVTRERIRQIEEQFWRRLNSRRHMELLRTIWLALVKLTGKPGGLVRSADDDLTPYVCFAAECLRIPYVHTIAGGLIVLGTSDQVDYSCISEIGWPIAVSDSEKVAALLDSQVYPFLDRDAIRRIAQAIVNGAHGKLSKSDKVYLVLKHIGRRAHYSEVARVYNQMHPEDAMSEHNIHAILSRCAAPAVEQYGIVWVRARGMYGLREDGYVRPELSLFDTVTKIVEEKYDTTQKSVHINAIVAEMGRYRHEVNPASLAFATSMNMAIREVEKGYFMPSEVDEEAVPDVNTGNIDRALREFREAHAEVSNGTDTQ